MKAKTGEILLLDPMRVKPFADQPRKRFRGIPKLAASIARIGQTTPIIITPLAENGFVAELIDGERRLQACRHGKLMVRAMMEAAHMSPRERFARAVAANRCRQEHDAMEDAEAIRRLKADGWSIEEIGEIFGHEPAWVYQQMRLFDLAPEVQKMIERPGDDAQNAQRERQRGKMTRSLALLLAPLSHALQVQAARKIARKRLSVVAAAALVRNMAHAKGVTVGKTRSPRAVFQVLWNALDTTRHSIDRYAGLSHRDLSAILACGNARERRVMAEQVETIGDTLRILAREIRKAGQS